MHHTPQLKWLRGHYESWIISTELLITPSRGSNPISSYPRVLRNTPLGSLGGWFSSVYLANTPVLSMAVSTMDLTHPAVSLTFKHCHGEWHKALFGSFWGPTCWLPSWWSCIGTTTLYHASSFFLSSHGIPFLLFSSYLSIVNSLSGADFSSVVLVFPHDWCFALRRCQFFLGAKQLGLIHCIHLLSKWLDLLWLLKSPLYDPHLGP